MTAQEIEHLVAEIRTLMDVIADAEKAKKIPVEALRGSLTFKGDIIEPLEEWDVEQ
jgi:hypothetical protein